MRLTNVLRAQHIDFMFKRHWRIQGKRTPRETGAKAELEARGIKVIDALEFIKPPVKFRQLTFPSEKFKTKNLQFDETHKFWNDRKCHIYRDSNVLLEGMTQAQVLTKTIVINGLPKTIENRLANIKIPDQSDDIMKKSILMSHVFDAHQEKLVIRKLADRPAFNLPRDYGITDSRKNRLIIAKMLLECEKLSGRSTTVNRKIINDVSFIFPFERNEDLIQMEINAETYITSKKPIAETDPNLSANETELPDIFPLKYTVSLLQENIYQLEDVYPIKNGCSFSHPHTILLHFSPLEVSNLSGISVSDTQFNSRSLIKAFTVAAASARAEFGTEVKDLPRPIVVQCIQTNGQLFYFGVFQLNTLDFDGTTGIKNYWYQVPSMDLFSECRYKIGRPVLNNYNKDVFKYLYTFYRNN